MTENNKWFVANDNGDVIGHDLPEMKAKLLADEMRNKKTFYISFYGSSGNGYVSYDNESCNSLDMAMTFENEEEANNKCEELKNEWASELKVDFISDETWEALNEKF